MNDCVFFRLVRLYLYEKNICLDIIYNYILIKNLSVFQDYNDYLSMRIGIFAYMMLRLVYD